jgi:DNA-binding NtrC family response regulator
MSMTRKLPVLVVAPTTSLATTVFAWLTDAGCAPLVVSSFAAAKPYLDDHPALLISEVRLGEYNGLHLALRAQGRGVPAVLVGEPDSVLQREAAQLGAVYLSSPFDAQHLLSVIQPMMEAAVTVQPWRPETANISFVTVSARGRSARHPNPFRS